MLTLAGEQSAYETLVVRHQRAVMASAVSVTHNQHMAEDASQDASRHRMDEIGHPAGRQEIQRVCRIAKNCALNMVRRFRSYLPFEAQNLAFDDGQAAEPAELCIGRRKRRTERKHRKAAAESRGDHPAALL
ncbi:MAG: RNA polymerase sigma factor [Acutalibacteraceae bacterium]